MSATKSDDINPNFVYIDTFLNRTRCDLLINGYIKWIEKEMNIIIPQPIITLIVLFYFSTLPQYRCGSKCIVDEQNQIFRSIKGPHALTYAILNTPWSKGKHELIFKCIQEKKAAIGIGLITNYNAHSSSWIFDACGAGVTYQIYSCRSRFAISKSGIYCYESGQQKFLKY